MQRMLSTSLVPHRAPTMALAVGLSLSGAVAVSLDAQEAQGNWHGFVGVGGATLGSYYGTDARRDLPFPYLRIEYRDRLYFGASETGLGGGLGVYLHRGRVDWTVDLAGAEPRRERLADVLAGMGNRKESAFAGTSVTLRYGIASVSASAAAGLADSAGVLGTVRLAMGGAFASRWSVALAGSVTAADRRNMAYDFGVSPEAAARRRALVEAGDRRLRGNESVAFAPRGGVKDVRSTVQLGYALTPRWQMVSVVSAGWLQGDAAASPLARKRSALTAGLGAAWRF